MDHWLLQLIIVIVTAVIVIVAFIPVIRYLRQERLGSSRPVGARPYRAKPRVDIIDMEARDEQGTRVAARQGVAASSQTDAASGGRAKGRFRFARLPNIRLPALRLPSWRMLAMLAVLLVVLVGGVWQWLEFRARLLRDQFVVVVAPFNDAGSGETGAAVAHSLARLLQEEADGRMLVQQVEQAPADERAALALAEEQVADVVVWGTVRPGGRLDEVSLQPNLTYAPRGAYAPNAWIGYMGRFAIPSTYVVSSEPVNGRVIVPPLLRALADYSSGDADSAYEQLGMLLDTYQLNASFLRALRGNILWARGSYDGAAAEYRQALAEATSDQGLLANNLSAILLDDGDGAVMDSLNEAVRLQGERDLGALHFNAGMLASQQERSSDAVAAYEQARGLLPASTPLLLALSDAYRETGQFDQAEAALSAARSQLPLDAQQVPDSIRSLMQEYLQSAILEQEGLLALSRLVDVRAHLAWELEVTSPDSIDAVQEVTDRLRQAVQRSDNLIIEWRRRAAAAAVAQNFSGAPLEPESEMVAAGQIMRIETIRSLQQYHLSLALIEEGETLQAHNPNVFDEFWRGITGGGNPLVEAQGMLDALLMDTTEDVPVLVADARSVRLQKPDEEEQAQLYQQYDTIISIAPGQPEGYYGKGQLALMDGDREAARQLMRQALDLNAAFFPARLQLITLAEQEGDWATALEHLRLLNEQYPRAETTVRMAAVLRRSGPAGFDEAARLLQPLIASNNSDALIELGRVYADAGRLDDAIQSFEQARDLDGLPPPVALELGRMLVEKGAYVQAEEQFLAAMETDEGEVRMQASLEVAELYAGPLQQAERAVVYYGYVLSEDVQDPAVLVSVGERLLAHDRAAPAIEAFQRAAAIQPNDPAIAYHLAGAYMSVENYPAAATQAQRVLDLTGNAGAEGLRAAALVILGDTERLNGNLDNAANYYNLALSLDPVLVDAAVGLGQVAVAEDNWPVALGQFKRAVDFPTAQDNALAHFWYAEALLRQRQFEEALTYYDRALELRSPFPAALLGMAQAQYMQGHADEASATVERALQQDDEYAEALLFKGKLLQERGQTEAALAAYNRCIMANDQLAESYYRRGIIYLELLRNESAANDLRRAAALQPNNAEIYYWLGQANFSLDRMVEAEGAFARAVELRNGDYAAARYFQGLAEESQGKMDAAIASFQAVIQSADGSEWASRSRVALQRIGVQ